MKTLKLSVILVWAFFLPYISLLNAQEPQCLAVITNLNGNVMLKKAGKTEFLKTYWGTQLNQGDQIRTSADSEATLIFSNNTMIKLGPEGSVTISGDEPSPADRGSGMKKVSTTMMVNISSLTSKKEVKKDVGALAGLRGIDAEQSIDPVSPFNTLLKTNRPDFMWLPRKNYDRFIVNLYNSRGLVWSKKVSETALNFPESEQGLAYGETYFWNVEGEDLLENDKSISYKFSILSTDKSKEVVDQETMIKNSFINDPDSCSLHSFLGAYYMNQGLLLDAVNEFEIISGMNPQAPLPHEILGSLYSEAGNKDKAIEELQKALALSKNGKEK